MLTLLIALDQVAAVRSAISHAQDDRQWWQQNAARLNAEQASTCPGGSPSAEAIGSGKGDAAHMPEPSTVAPSCTVPARTRMPGAAASHPREQRHAKMPEQPEARAIVRTRPVFPSPRSLFEPYVAPRELELPVPNGDLPLGKGPLARARVLAAKALLGKKAAGKEDEQLLHMANRAHLDALAHPDDQAAALRSQGLIQEEARIWAHENGGDKLQLPKETIIRAYLEAWDLPLRPPVPPRFKSFPDIKKELLLKIPLQVRLQDLISGSRVRETRIEKAATQRYHQQFADCIANDLPRLSKAILMANARKVGLPKLFLEHRPKETWAVDRIS